MSNVKISLGARKVLKDWFPDELADLESGKKSVLDIVRRYRSFKKQNQHLALPVLCLFKIPANHMGIPHLKLEDEDWP